jgi:hypothetical protein
MARKTYPLGNLAELSWDGQAFRFTSWRKQDLASEALQFCKIQTMKKVKKKQVNSSDFRPAQSWGPTNKFLCFFFYLMEHNITSDT